MSCMDDNAHARHNFNKKGVIILSTENSDILSAQKSIIKAMEIIAQKYTKNQTKIYSGIVLSISENNYTVNMNGKTYVLKSLEVLSVNDNIRICVPQGNMSQAFILGSIK